MKIFVVSETMISQFIVGEVQKLKNFLTFDKIYKNCKVFKLEQIIDLQKIYLKLHLILSLTTQIELEKNFWSSSNQGELVKLNCYKTGKEEAQGISDIIEQIIKKILFK